MSLAFYRKYRPRKLSELVGHETTAQILKNAAKSNRLSQAYLFYGSRGTGKTTTARLVAKLLNCEKRHSDHEFQKLGESCNKCLACAEIDRGASMDVIEIDAASNRGIDEIRNLKENIITAPVSGRCKVYIIDEAHMLTGAAFNALLKTLEEPPKHATLILATTEYEKLPPTIVSRTQRFLFRKLNKTEIMEKLKRVANGEKIEISSDALELLASAAEGSLRDAESLLDQISAFHKKIDLASAEHLIGRIGFHKVENMSEILLMGDRKLALEQLNSVQEDGYNVVQFVKDVIHYLRKALTLRLNPDMEKVFAGELTEEEIKRLKRNAALVVPEKHIPLLRAILRAYSEMRYSPFAAIPLEIAIAENLK